MIVVYCNLNMILTREGHWFIFTCRINQMLLKLNENLLKSKHFNNINFWKFKRKVTSYFFSEWMQFKTIFELYHIQIEYKVIKRIISYKFNSPQTIFYHYYFSIYKCTVFSKIPGLYTGWDAIKGAKAKEKKNQLISRMSWSFHTNLFTSNYQYALFVW